MENEMTGNKVLNETIWFSASYRDELVDRKRINLNEDAHNTEDREQNVAQ